MKTEIFAQPVLIIGLELRTDNTVADKTIPVHWQQFYSQAVIEQIPNKISSDVYAIYTKYTNEGVDNTGTYSCVIGTAVSSLENLPSHLTAIFLPASSYQVVSVARGHPELVSQAWQEIWQQDITTRTFIADFERYQADGKIDILLGVRS